MSKHDLEREFKLANAVTESVPQYGAISYHNEPKDPPRFAGGGFLKKAIKKGMESMGESKTSRAAGEELNRIAGADVSTPKDLTTVEDFHSGLMNEIERRAFETKKQMDAFDYLYSPNDYVFTEWTAKNNKPPHKILSPAMTNVKMLGKDSEGNKIYAPRKPGYWVESTDPDGNPMKYIIPEDAILGKVEPDKYAGGGLLKKAAKKAVERMSKAESEAAGLYHPIGGGLKLPKPVSEYKFETIQDPRFSPEVRRLLSPEDFLGKVGIPLLGDRARAGRLLTEIEGRKLDEMLALEGGPEFMMNYPYLWASDKAVINKLAKQARKAAESGKDVLGVNVIGSPTNVDFNKMVSGVLFDNLDVSSLRKKDIKAFDAEMRKSFPEFLGLEHPDVKEQMFGPNMGTKRTEFVKIMNKDKYQSSGFPDVTAARIAVTEPRLLDMPTGSSGFTVGKFDPDNLVIENPEIVHETYPVKAGGEYVGGLEAPLDFKDVFTDFSEARRMLGGDPTRDLRAFSFQSPAIQEFNQEWLDKVMPTYEEILKSKRYAGGGLLKKVSKEVLKSKGKYGAERVEKAADLVPDLEKQFNEKALLDAFTGDNAKGLMVLDPAHFEEYAEPLSPTIIRPGPYESKIFHRSVPEGLSYSEYLDYLLGFANNGGFTSVPYLGISQKAPNEFAVTAHEGRHRSRALSKRGDKKILIEMRPESGMREPFPRFTQEDYIDAINAHLGLDPEVSPEVFPDVKLSLPKIFAKGGKVDLENEFRTGISQKDLVSAGKSAYKQLNVPNPKSPFDIAVTQRQPVKGAKQAIINLGEEFKKLQDPQNAFNAMLGTIAPVEGAAKATVNFVSSVEKAIKGHKMESMSGEQWANWMRANASKSAKKEAEATGLYNWLKSQGKVSKAEIEAYVEGNLPKIQEKSFGMTMSELNPTQLGRLAYLEKENAKAPLGAIDDVLGEGAYEEMITLQNIRDKSTVDKLYEAQPELERKANIAQQRGDIELAKKYWNEVSHLSARAEHLDLRGAGLKDTTKFGQYTEPGGQNYQEIAYSLPRRPMRLSEFKNELMPGAMDEEKVNRAYEEYLQNPSRYSWADTYRVPSGHTYGDEVADMNRLLHLRTNERQTPEGKRALFLEELQSDWAQKARKHGIKKDITDEDLRQYHESVRKETDPAWEELPSKDKAFLRHILENRQTEAVPEGPYITDTKDWTALGLKQALKKAIDEGHDVLAWTTGAQQADRYKLSKYLENVRASKSPDGTYSFLAYEKGADRGNLPTIAQHNLTEDDLAEHLGKDMAQKIVNDLAEAKPAQVANYDNIDLQLGGEGMKGYYDQIVPQTMNDILKQYGIKDGVKEISIGPAGKSYDDIIKELGDWNKYPRGSAEREALVRQLDTAPDIGHNEYSGTHLGIEITPELREKIMNEGLPYFKGGGEIKGYKSGGDLEEEFRKADMIVDPRLLPKSVVKALNTKRKLTPAEAKMAGKYANPENQWDLGSILEEIDPIYTASRGARTLKNVDLGAIGDIALQRYQLAKDPRASIKKGLENIGEAAFGALDVAPIVGGVASKAGRNAIKNLVKEFEGAPAGMSIKPVGGQWFPRGVEFELEDLKMADTESPVNKAVNAWVDGTLRKYLMNRMGTESDEVRKLFDEGIHHVDPSNLNFSNYLEDIEANRRNNYYGRELAKTSRGRAWEYASDSAIFPRVAGNLGSHIKETYPWINKLPPEEKIYTLSSVLENNPDVMRNLGFDHVIDVLKSDILEGKLRPEQLNKVSVEDAIKRTHNYNIEMAKKAEEAGIMTQQGMPIHREYPEGYKWVELKYSEPTDVMPEGFEVKPIDYVDGERRYFAMTPNTRSQAFKTEEEAQKKLEEYQKNLKKFREETKTKEALNYEGESMGHCVGSYCEDVIGGNTRIFSLRDAEGKPHVTVEVSSASPHYRNKEVEKLIAQGMSPEEAELATENLNEIVQIKGKGNAKPADKYLPYVQDFVKNPVVDKNWAYVGDFQNTNLIDARAMREHGVLPDMDTESTNQILQEIERLYPTEKTPTGGLVFEGQYGRLIPNTDMLKYEVQDLPSPYLTKEDIIEHLRKREPRSIEQSYSKYYETPKEEGMASGGSISYGRDAIKRLVNEFSS